MVLIICFSYFIERGVCYLVLCDQSFSKRLAYSFLEDLQTEFSSIYGSKVETVSRPYSFIEFGKSFYFFVFFYFLFGIKSCQG